MSTHIKDSAVFAKTVLMPGDPCRAKWIAETFLHDYKLVTDVRLWLVVWAFLQLVFIVMNYSHAME